jgi:hypothetical protein
MMLWEDRLLAIRKGIVERNRLILSGQILKEEAKMAMEKDETAVKVNTIARTNEALTELVDFLQKPEARGIRRAFRVGENLNFDLDALSFEQMRLVLKLRVLQVWMEGDK